MKSRGGRMLSFYHTPRCLHQGELSPARQSTAGDAVFGIGLEASVINRGLSRLVAD